MKKNMATTALIGTLMMLAQTGHTVAAQTEIDATNLIKFSLDGGHVAQIDVSDSQIVGLKLNLTGGTDASEAMAAAFDEFRVGIDLTAQYDKLDIGTDLTIDLFQNVEGGVYLVDLNTEGGHQAYTVLTRILAAVPGKLTALKSLLDPLPTTIDLASDPDQQKVLEDV